MKQHSLPKFLYEREGVSVAWEDAAGFLGEGFVAETFLSQLKPVIRRTAGYVLSYNKDRIVLAGTDDRFNGDSLRTDCEDLTVIPCGMIRRIIRINT